MITWGHKAAVTADFQRGTLDQAVITPEEDIEIAPNIAYSDLIVDGITIELNEATYEYNQVKVINGGTLVINGRL